MSITISANIRHCKEVKELRPYMVVAVEDEMGALSGSDGRRYNIGIINKVYEDKAVVSYFSYNFSHDISEIFIIENI